MEIEINENSNENLIEDFMYYIDSAIESGNANKLKIYIDYYKNLIPISYINIAINVYNELILEKIEDLNINS